MPLYAVPTEWTGLCGWPRIGYDGGMLVLALDEPLVFDEKKQLVLPGDTLGGELVDDNRNPLGESQLDHIRREFIGKPQATMRSFGLAAGSPQALRLFS